MFSEDIAETGSHSGGWLQRDRFPGFFNAAPGLTRQRRKGYWCGIPCPESCVAPQWQEQFLLPGNLVFFLVPFFNFSVCTNKLSY